MRAFKRAERVGPLIQEILAQLISREIKDPRVQDAVITAVTLADDMKLARVWFRTVAVDRRAVQAGLESARGYLRRELGSRLQMKFTPELQFRYDEAVDRAARIESILKDIHRE